MAQFADQGFLGLLLTTYLAGDRRATVDSPGSQLVRVVEQVYAAIGQGDYTLATSYMTEDVEMEIIGPVEVPLVGSWRGRAQAETAIRNNFGRLEEQHPEILSVAAYHDSVLVMGRERGRVRQTGREYQVHWVQWFTFRDGLVCRFLETFDSQTIAQAFA
jgi:ketosteroid isomerase-like protein